MELASATTDDHLSSNVALQLQIGLDHLAAGRAEEAIAAFRRGLAAAGEAEPGAEQGSTVADLHFRLGNALMLRGDLDGAAETYKAALRIAPQLASCWCNFGNIHLRWNRPQDAISIYLHVLSLEPRHWAARTNLVEALVVTRQFVIARALLLELIGERPQDAALRHQLGKVHFELGDTAQALESFERAVAIDPTDADSLYWIGGITQRAGDDEAARLAYARGAQARPLIRRPTRQPVADFRVLALYAPFGGNTPAEYLFRDVGYDVNTLPLFTDNSYDVEALRGEGDLVVNLVSDADQAETMLSVAADLADRLGKTVLNDPRKVMRTTREGVASALQGIPDCLVPRVVRCAAGSVSTPGVLPGAFPILARPAGTHGGDDFEKIESLVELEAFAARFPDVDRYLIAYVDYRSIDGFFRKYRFIFVNDEILPYHLAIADEWKLHHDNTDMANQPWMQHEEKIFLDDPSAVFSAAHFQALDAIRRAIGLDYSGIDCGLDAAGRLVVFEVNASMLVHDHNESFPYKTPAVQRIKRAFDAMLHRRAAEARVIDAPPLQPLHAAAGPA